MTQTLTKKLKGHPGNCEDCPHPERDPAKVPAPFLTHAQIQDLQAEVLKLRLKRRNQREAIASLNRAMERKSYLLLRSNADRTVLNDDFESLRERYNQIKNR